MYVCVYVCEHNFLGEFWVANTTFQSVYTTCYGVLVAAWIYYLLLFVFSVSRGFSQLGNVFGLGYLVARVHFVLVLVILWEVSITLIALITLIIPYLLSLFYLFFF